MSSSTHTLVAIFLCTGLALAGCSKKTDSSTGTAATATEPAATAAAAPAADPAAEAKKFFKTTCTPCHGEDGKGDGPGAAALDPKPRDYTDAKWQASVTDEQIEKTILMGGAAVGKSPAMPAQPSLRSKPEVVKELVKVIRGFKK